MIAYEAVPPWRVSLTPTSKKNKNVDRFGQQRHGKQLTFNPHSPSYIAVVTLFRTLFFPAAPGKSNLYVFTNTLLPIAGSCCAVMLGHPCLVGKCTSIDFRGVNDVLTE